jgi:internalin A
MSRHGREILRDCEQMRPGDRISEFMKRLVEGDRIITVISDRYLKSPYCMNELFRIYRNCGMEPDRFLSRVIPMILPDALLGSESDRFAYAVHWKKERAKLEKLLNGNVDVMGEEMPKKFHMMQDFARHVADILEYLADKLMPRDFDCMAADDFKEVMKLIE